MKLKAIKSSDTNSTKKTSRFYIYIASVCLLLVVLSIVYFLNLNVFILSPQVAKMFTGEYPKAFCSSNGENSSLHQFFTYSDVDKNGNLILMMTNRQIENWKNTNFYLQLLQKIVGDERQVVSKVVLPTDPVLKSLYEGADIACGYEVSEDYTQVYADFEDSKFLYFPLLPYPCIAMQVLSGKASDEICYTFIEYDEAGNIVNRFVWPDDFLDELNVDN